MSLAVAFVLAPELQLGTLDDPTTHLYPIPNKPSPSDTQGRDEVLGNAAQPAHAGQTLLLTAREVTHYFSTKIALGK